MSDILVLRARLRKRDKDIQQAVNRLKLEEGEMADMVRDGFRRMLAEKEPIARLAAEPITVDDARLIARELMREQRKKSPPPQG